MKDLTETNICKDLNEVRENIDRVDNEIIKQDKRRRSRRTRTACATAGALKP